MGSVILNWATVQNNIFSLFTTPGLVKWKHWVNRRYKKPWRKCKRSLVQCEFTSICVRFSHLCDRWIASRTHLPLGPLGRYPLRFIEHDRETKPLRKQMRFSLLYFGQKVSICHWKEAQKGFFVLLSWALSHCLSLSKWPLESEPKKILFAFYPPSERVIF